MNKFKYLKLNKYKKIRYLSVIPKNKIYIVFLHGFMSDLEGEKPKNLLKYCKNKNLGFLGLEYSGHGNHPASLHQETLLNGQMKLK